MNRLSRRVDRLECRGSDPFTNSIYAAVTLADASDFERARRLAVEAGLPGPCVCLGEEGVDAISVKRIIIAHQNDWRCLVFLAKCSNHLKGLAQGLPRFQGP